MYSSCCLLWQRWHETTLRQEAAYGSWREKHVSEVSVKNVVSLWGRAANFSANPISTGGLPGIWLPKPTWDRSYLLLLWLSAAWTKAQAHMTHDLWTMTTKNFVAIGCLCLNDTELIHSEKTLQNIVMCWQDQACDWRTGPQMTGTEGGRDRDFPSSTTNTITLHTADYLLH